MSWKDRLLRRDPHREEQLRAQRQRELEQGAQDSLYLLYVGGEERLLDSSEHIRSIGKNASPGAEFTTRRSAQSASNRLPGRIDRLMELAAGRILDEIPEPERQHIHVNAVTGAINFWEQHLQQPKLPKSQQTLGQSRLDQLNRKLAQLTEPKPPQPPRG